MLYKVKPIAGLWKMIKNHSDVLLVCRSSRAFLNSHTEEAYLPFLLNYLRVIAEVRIHNKPI
jgi:hypothetical protein